MIDSLLSRVTKLWLAAMVALFLAAAACSAPAPPPTPRPSAGISTAACTDETTPAVRLEVVDESDEPLIGASLRYGVDQGPWLDWPENIGRNTVIRGRPGLYRVEVDKQGYDSHLALIEVPAASDDACQPVAQTARLQLARTPCPNPPADLSLRVNPAIDGLRASARLPESGRQQLDCLESVGDACQELSLLAAEFGTYEVTLEGLPSLGPMLAEGNIIAYDPQPVTFHLEHRGVSQSSEISGAEGVVLRFPVRRDEANCALADLRALETTSLDDGTGAEAGDSERRPPLTLRYLGSLTMTNLGAAICQMEPVLAPLTFGAELPAGTNLADVQVEVHYGEGWVTAECEFGDGRYLCQAPVPNPLLDRPFVARVLTGDEEATGMSLPLSGMCLLFE